MLNIIKQNNAQLNTLDFKNDTLIIDPIKKQIAFAEEGGTAAVIGGSSSTSVDSGVYNLNGNITIDEWNTLSQQYHTFIITEDVTIDSSGYDLNAEDIKLLGPSNVRGDYLSYCPKLIIPNGLGVKDVSFYNVNFAELLIGDYKLEMCNFKKCIFTPKYNQNPSMMIDFMMGGSIFDSCLFDCNETIRISGYGVVNYCKFFRNNTTGASSFIHIEPYYFGPDYGDIFLNGCDFDATYNDCKLNMDCFPPFHIWVQNCKYKTIDIANDELIHFSNNIVNGELQDNNETIECSDCVKMITGSYSGDNNKSGRLINLDGTPKAVLICDIASGGIGMAINGVINTTDETPYVEIATGGFIVKHATPSSNSIGKTYTYIAFF